MECDFEWLEKYFGSDELRPLWDNASSNFKRHINASIAAIEQNSPLLEEDVALIAQALAEMKKRKEGAEVLFKALDDVNMKCWQRREGAKPF